MVLGYNGNLDQMDRGSTHGLGGFQGSGRGVFQGAGQVSVRQNLVAAFVAVGVIAPPVWMLLDREPPYRFEHVEIAPANVVQGGEISITFTIKPLRTSCGPGLIYREFKEETGKLHVYDPIQRVEAPVLNDNKFTRYSKLPDNISPGQTIYRGISCYTCNPMQGLMRWPVCASTPSATFNVVEKANDRR